MAPSHYISLTPAEQQQLLAIARGSIAHGLQSQKPLAIDGAQFTGMLAAPHGNFVTLTQGGTLRGCMGAIYGAGSLAQDVALTACNAAFKDSRFAKLTPGELNHTLIDISVLSLPALIPASSLAELTANIRPHEQGLIVEDRGRRATLLPKVWEQLPDTHEFITQLMGKAGLPANYWSDTIQFYGYEARSFSETQLKPDTAARPVSS